MTSDASAPTTRDRASTTEGASVPAAVLWDMDGTLVDTEPYWMASEHALVASFGGVWTHEDAMSLVGSGLPASARILQGKGVDLPVQAIIDRMTDEVVAQLAGGIPWRPGALELLSAVREAGVRQALVTMSIGRMARAVVDRLPFAAFDAVVSGDMVERSKPDPEAYLLAAQTLGVDIADCVAIEDSHAGLASAVAAGAAVIGVPHQLELVVDGPYAHWPTLAGRTVADLAQVSIDHRGSRPHPTETEARR
ncbi:haloacid dehalogenase superfamily, subfamily IA, variant 3 with third motif having DD or ED [Rathayibacter oskolensis]|uniref:Haloacid dehalogenase superfamily, subfamily IA, variant 3 with third motif having DD or ED n=1 Tax=Rathayibacter oskolensis TaxID=1891671 RepID=A0A1X7NLZ3_9MICO|nr:HAD family phosphatase [Rathayibacter oskolensis]SMH38536.1 haloacid dehalogenase superfamily, subfamily IA, variant 3 with third motif having DD or ED [Rathayibacter oskolensis]